MFSYSPIEAAKLIGALIEMTPACIAYRFWLTVLSHGTSSKPLAQP